MTLASAIEKKPDTIEAELKHLIHITSLEAGLHEIKNCMLRAYWCSDGERYARIVEILDQFARKLDDTVPKDPTHPEKPTCRPGYHEVNGMCVQDA